MSLQDLERRINKRGEDDPPKVDFEKKEIKSSDVPDETQVAGISGGEEKWSREEIHMSEPREKRISGNLKKKIFIWGIIFAVVALIGSSVLLFYFLKNRSSFREKDIIFEIEYSEEVTSGLEEMITIKYGNFSRVDLNDVVVSFHRPDSMIMMEEDKMVSIQNWKIDTIAKGESDKIEIPVQIFGAEGSAHLIEAEIQYRPVNFNSIFSKKTDAKINIESCPIKVSVEAPDEIVSGELVEYGITCENLSDTDFSDLILKVDFPSGFLLESAVQLSQSEADITMRNSDEININVLDTEETVEFVLSGNLFGDVSEEQNIGAKIGVTKNDHFYVYNEASDVTILKMPAIQISQSVQGDIENIDIRESIQFVINVKNTSQNALNGVVVSTSLEGSAIDFSSLSASNGFVSSDNSIEWSSSGINSFGYFPSMSEETLEFSLRIKKTLPMSGSATKNFVVSSIPSATAVGIESQIAGNEIKIRVNSKLNVVAKGSYYGNGGINNFGPIPPKVGETTTYTIRWQLLNVANDVKNVKVRASLPPGIGWGNNSFTASGNVSFSNITRTVMWDIGTIPANTGIKAPLYEAIFQVSTSPALPDVGKTMLLLDKTECSGEDVFTREMLSATADAKTTNLPEDKNLTQAQYRVVK